jgi:hypothetical protein
MKYMITYNTGNCSGRPCNYKLTKKSDHKMHRERNIIQFLTKITYRFKPRYRSRQRNRIIQVPTG